MGGEGVSQGEFVGGEPGGVMKEFMGLRLGWGLSSKSIRVCVHCCTSRCAVSCVLGNFQLRIDFFTQSKVITASGEERSGELV